MHFDHINIRPRDMEAARDFLVAVLGVRVGWRPPFDYPGYWLYDADDRPVIHIQPPGEGERDGEPLLNHFAFAFYDYDAKLEELRATGYPLKLSAIPGTEIRQIFVIGPEGLRVELQAEGPSQPA